MCAKPVKACLFSVIVCVSTRAYVIGKYEPWEGTHILSMCQSRVRGYLYF